MKPSLEVFDYLEIKKPGSATPCKGGHVKIVKKLRD